MSAPAVSGLTDGQAEALETIRKMPPGIERAQMVKVLASECGVSSAAVEAELGGLEGDGGPGQGQAVILADPEPWPAAVEGAELLDELARTFRRFLALPPHADESLALWTLHAHAHNAAEISPLLAIVSPVQRCGKTTALILIGALVPRPLHAANVTPAATFRTIERFRPTFLVDEADSFLSGNDELRGVLNSGHVRRSAVIVRTVGEDFEARHFSTWCPKAIALIGRLPATLRDRSIEVAMRRRTREEKVERIRQDRLEELGPIARRAWRWSRDHDARLRKTDPEIPDALHDRAADNWRPLLAIADLAGGGWPAKARRAALALSGQPADDDEPAGVLALLDVANLFEQREEVQLSSETVVEALVAMDERPWPEWYKGRPLSKRGLARILSPFNVRPRAVWIAGRTVRGYRREDLIEPLRRYCPRRDPPLHPQGPQEPQSRATNGGFWNRKGTGTLADLESTTNPHGSATLADLADRNPLSGTGGPL